MKTATLALSLNALVAGSVWLSGIASASTPPVEQACHPLDQTHANWSALLRDFTNDGHVAYTRLKSEGLERLDSYLSELAGVCRSDFDGWSESAQLAYWINAYNAFTVKLIVENLPLDSIRDIGVLPGAPWRREFISLPMMFENSVSLDFIEHETIRVDFAEPRIHFALVCAAVGCPKLMNEAYTGESLESQLDGQTRGYLADRRWNRFDEGTNTLHLSQIFEWFAGDFTKEGATVKGFVAAHYGEGAERVEEASKVEVTAYDWALNGE